MRQGEERKERFDGLFAAHCRDVVSYCSWRVGTAGDAQDAAADVFLTAWRRLEAVPDGDAARIWLYATARKVIANHRRAHRRRVALQERLAHEPARQPAWLLGGEATLVHEALRRLRPLDREVLLLAEWEGFSSAELAGILGCRAVTARGRLHRARRRFRSVFDELRAPAAPRRIVAKEGPEHV